GPGPRHVRTRPPGAAFVTRARRNHGSPGHGRGQARVGSASAEPVERREEALEVALVVVALERDMQKRAAVPFEDGRLNPVLVVETTLEVGVVARWQRRG